ncbi:MAG: formimidoylglutamate deiminase [Hyphomicrobiales bacterium]|nr:formimidoylglutamate deiminase [Hyphomicrobiales bacterium]
MPVIHAATALTPEGWKADVRLTIEGDAIAAIEAGRPPEAGDERQAIVLPALANVHSHAFQRGMAGLAEYRGERRDTFWTWRETMYRFALTMSPDDIEAVAAQLYVEMLEAGFAAVGEFHYLHNAPDGSPYAARAELAARIASAASQTGLGLTLLPVFYAHATFGGAPPLPEQRRFITDVDEFGRLLEESRAVMRDVPRGVVGVAPHSLRAAAPSELAAVVALAGQAPIHIHAAEQVKEVEDCLNWSGSRPVAWLLEHAPIDPRWCLIHATHMTEDETRRLARTGAVAGLCPITEANLGDGIFNAPEFLAEGGLFGVGSDSNVQIGVGAELRQLEYSQRLRDRARNVSAIAAGSTGRALYETALAGGARALARPSGRLAPGAIADMVSLQADHPALAGRVGDQTLDAWIFSGGNGIVDSVWSGGRKLVVNGRHASREAVAARFGATMRALLSA